MSTAASVINRVRYLINDEVAAAVSGQRWTDAELLLWLYDAQCAVIKAIPEANPVTATHTMTALSRQRLSATLYFKLLSLEGHAAPSATAGNIVKVMRDLLDAHAAAWQTTATTTAYTLYALDADDPLAFWLYPFPTVGLDVRITASGVPSALPTTSDVLTLSDMYFEPMVDYVAWRALLKDSRGGAKERAAMHEKSFFQSIGMDRTVLKETT